jgi:hypothetical protein
MRKATIVFLFLVCLTGAAAAQNVKVSSYNRISVKAGEAQSTVVPPKVSSDCKGGRFLVSSDFLKPPTKGVVIGRDLDDPTGPELKATFDEAGSTTPSPYDVSISADHDLLTLNNGHILYLLGAGSRKAVSNPPAWFNDTFRGALGPGARSVLLVWRSTDCGKSFHYLGEADPLAFEDGSCANPQFIINADGSKKLTPPWDMGGSDGQLVTVDPSTNRLYMTFQCVGYKAKAGTPGFVLDPAAKLNKTLVVESTNEGQNWKSLGFMNGYKAWRFGLVPMSDDLVALSYYDGVTFGKRNGQKMDFDPTFVKPPDTVAWGYTGGFPFLAGGDNPYLKAWMWAHTVIGRTPNSSKSVFVAYPSTVPGKGQGLRFFFADVNTKSCSLSEPPIVPMTPGINNFIFHPVITSSASAPPLLYWYDVDWGQKTAIIRGRFITGDGEYTDDFTISRQDGKDRSFALTKQCPPGYWYGDYHTAGGGFVSSATLNTGETTFTYFPMWIEPDNGIQFTRVDFTVKSKVVKPNLTFRRIPLNRFVDGVRVDPRRISRPVLEREEIEP